MQKKKRNNQGFSLIELIIVVAILAVLVGILAPQFLKYVERAKRVKDVNTAVEIRDAFSRVYTYQTFNASVGGAFYTAAGWDNNTPMPVPAPDNDWVDLVFLDLGCVPQSSTFKNFMWYVYPDTTYGSIQKIELWETAGPGGRPVRGYEIWPNSDDFMYH